MHVRFVSMTAALSLSAMAFAQGGAPRETVTATVNGKKVTVEYGRPALKGRTVDTLLKDLPEDKMWRTGSEQVTTLTTETDLLIGGKKVPAGKYSLYVHAPATGDWSLAINTDQGVPLGKIWDKAPDNMKNEPWPHLEGYQKNIGDKEVVRAPMKKAAVASPVEMFTITLAPTPAKDGAVMKLAWGDRSWSVDLKAAK